jgi:hypothetical protein
MMDIQPPILGGQYNEVDTSSRHRCCRCRRYCGGDVGAVRRPGRHHGHRCRLIQQNTAYQEDIETTRASTVLVTSNIGHPLPIVKVSDMNSARRLVVGAVVAAATAAVLWGPTAVLAGLTATAVD